MKASLRILNLEDNALDAALNGEMLSARWPECELVRVQNREDFMAALEDGGFDIILSDFSMPGFDGLQALALARVERPQVPFLFVSGTIGEDTAIEALKNGATDYILKHRLMRLIPAVDRALREVGEHAEYKRAEESMRQSEHKYRELFESLTDAAFLADEQCGKIIDSNRAAEDLLGRTRAEIVGHNLSEFLTPDESAQPPEEISTSGAQKKFPCESRLIRVNNVTISVNVRATRLTLYGRPLVLWLCREIAEPRSA